MWIDFIILRLNSCKHFLQIFEVTIDVKIVWDIKKLVKPTFIIT